MIESTQRAQEKADQMNSESERKEISLRICSTHTHTHNKSNNDL